MLNNQETIRDISIRVEAAVLEVVRVIVELPHLKDKMSIISHFGYLFSNRASLTDSGIIQTHLREYLIDNELTLSDTYTLNDIVRFALREDYADTLLSLAIENEERYLDRLFTDKEVANLSTEYREEIQERFLSEYVDDYVKMKTVQFYFN